jgi:predicted nucleic-acid-binding Zn-ribbon protein
MRNGECPKCSSHEIYTSDEDGEGFGGDESSSLNCGLDSTDKWRTYLCANCGYYENYLTDKDMIANIVAQRRKMKSWKKVGT